MECRQNGHVDKPRATTKYACDKGWSHIESCGSESRAKMARVHTDRVCKSMMQHVDLNYHMEQSTKSMHANHPILQHKKQFRYEQGRYISMLACQQYFVLEVVAPCTRNNSVHLTSFFGNVAGQL